MIVTMRTGLGFNIGEYHSSIVPRTQETICISKGGENQMLFKVIDVLHQIQDEQETLVEIEVRPTNQTACDYIGGMLSHALS